MTVELNRYDFDDELFQKDPDKYAHVCLRSLKEFKWLDKNSIDYYVSMVYDVICEQYNIYINLDDEDALLYNLKFDG